MIAGVASAESCTLSCGGTSPLSPPSPPPPPHPNMSVSVDDLVASFNSNHIGQEAIDLANLQVCLTSERNMEARL